VISRTAYDCTSSVIQCNFVLCFST
jgi:hypothetical protein